MALGVLDGHVIPLLFLQFSLALPFSICELNPSVLDNIFLEKKGTKLNILIPNLYWALLIRLFSSLYGFPTLRHVIST